MSSAELEGFSVWAVVEFRDGQACTNETGRLTFSDFHAPNSLED